MPRFMCKATRVRPRPLLLAAVLLAAGAPSLASAQSQPTAALRVQSQAEAVAQDGAAYAARYGVTLDEAVRRLRIQEDSVAATDRIRREHAGRLAGISVEHRPGYRIVVLLTGSEPVAAQSLSIGVTAVPIVFRTGAKATRTQVVSAMLQHRALLDRDLPNSRGMGLDQRTGELVLLVTTRTAARLGTDAIQSRAEAVTGVPVRIAIADPPATNLGVEGGARLEGTIEGRRYSCTTGFVVENGDRRGILTAAHCPDSPIYIDPDGNRLPLEFGGHWGVGHQDVQLHVTDAAERPLFYADRRIGALRELTGWRNRTSTRAGDFVCKWGESSTYSCSEVELTDYAPPGKLCGGPCRPMWITVSGPQCRAGDSGGPIFMGTTAFGITKGGSGTPGRCSFYYYMSTDFLPEGWSLAHARSEQRKR